MTAHTDNHVINSSDPRLALATALKFEPTELHEFDAADGAAGRMMGKLLAFLFCVLLFLMIGVNIWSLTHSSSIDDKDPQAFVYDRDGGHGAKDHH